MAEFFHNLIENDMKMIEYDNSKLIYNIKTKLKIH